VQLGEMLISLGGGKAVFVVFPGGLLISLGCLRHVSRRCSSENGTITDLASCTTVRRRAESECAACESKHPMNKRQLIDGIRQLNQTAQPEFLLQFDEESLDQYLKHLQNAQEKRLKIEGWVKSIPKPKFRLVS
jgi:hypothetical protein